MISRRELEAALHEQADEFLQDSRVLGGRKALEVEALEAGVELEDLEAVAQMAVDQAGPGLPKRSYVAAGFLLAARALRVRSGA